MSGYVCVVGATRAPRKSCSPSSRASCASWRLSLRDTAKSRREGSSLSPDGQDERSGRYEVPDEDIVSGVVGEENEEQVDAADAEEDDEDE